MPMLCLRRHFTHLSFRNLDSVMCVISSSDSSKSYAMASITSVHSDGTFDVKFDSKFSMRSRVPVDDILPVPNQLMVFLAGCLTMFQVLAASSLSDPCYGRLPGKYI